MNEGNCTGLHPYGPCAPDQGCNAPIADLDADPIQWALDQLALARAELDAMRARVAELEAKIKQLRPVAVDYWDVTDTKTGEDIPSGTPLYAALDAVPAAETTSGEQDLQFHCTHSTHEVAPLRCGGRHYGLPCGPGCAPVVS